MTNTFNHMWIVFIAVMVTNGLIWKFKSQSRIKENPSLKEGRDKLFKGWIIYSNIPWLLMGFGMLSGLTSSLNDYMLAQEQNPFVIFYHIVLLVINVLGTRWMFFQGGAESLVQHKFVAKGVEGQEKSEILKMKAMWLLVLLGGAMGFYTMMNNNFVGQ